MNTWKETGKYIAFWKINISHVTDNTGLRGRRGPPREGEEMARANIYRATNRETKENIEGTANELSAIIGCTPTTVNKLGLAGGSAYNWTVSLVKKAERKPQRNCSDKGFTRSLLKEWEDVTRLFRRKSSVG